MAEGEGTRECVDEGSVAVEHVGTSDQLADLLTKPLPKVKFLELRERIGLRHVKRQVQDEGRDYCEIEGDSGDLTDGTWHPVAPDPESVFVNVGDAMQVLTNGRYRSVRHRVVAEELRLSSSSSRLSMIYFGGPAPSETIVPVAGLMGELEASLYRSFTWGEYKTAAYGTRLADRRLEPFLLQQRLTAEESAHQDA